MKQNLIDKVLRNLNENPFETGFWETNKTFQNKQDEEYALCEHSLGTKQTLNWRPKMYKINKFSRFYPFKTLDNVWTISKV